MYTGKQQRDGVPVLPFIMAGLFRVERAPCAPGDNVGATCDDDAPRELIADADSEDCDGDVDQDDADVEAASLDKNFRFNWDRYHAVWQDTPIHKAIVEVFAEYATLYARISGQVRSTVPPPMTLSTGLSIAGQAARFVVNYVTPVLGEIASTKLHKLLCHVTDAIRWHGHLQNGNTAENEAIHKHDKQFYRRTNKHVADFTRQLVVFARGSEAVLKRLDAEDAARGPSGAGVARRRDPSSPARESDSTNIDTSRTGGAAGGARSRLEGAGGVSSYHLEKMSVSVLAAFPDLAHVASLLGLEDSAKVPVLSQRKIRAVMDCGTPNVQYVRASESFYKGPWHDAVLYRANPDQDTLSVGQVRAIVRLPVGDVAIICEMEPVTPEPGCPFFRRGCTRLAWRVAPQTRRIALRVVPVGNIRRLLFVVPDFEDLSQRRGPLALPPGRDGNQEERLAMRFFVNDFYPWDLCNQ